MVDRDVVYEKENFSLLYNDQIIDKSLKEKMEHMVGFRNVAVHDYESINPEILKSIVHHHLCDIEEFFTVIINKCLKNTKFG